MTTEPLPMFLAHLTFRAQKILAKQSATDVFNKEGDAGGEWGDN